ncbi:MAG: hypothetical protein HQ503_10760, partial [Rhodospirillales bacterium]|nr:hypothetical protein [Rhodospirillales bacterium]
TNQRPGIVKTLPVPPMPQPVSQLPPDTPAKQVEPTIIGRPEDNLKSAAPSESIPKAVASENDSRVLTRLMRGIAEIVGTDESPPDDKPGPSKLMPEAPNDPRAGVPPEIPPAVEPTSKQPSIISNFFRNILAPKSLDDISMEDEIGPQADTSSRAETEIASTSRKEFGRSIGDKPATSAVKSRTEMPVIKLTIGEDINLDRTLSDPMSRAGNCFQKGNSGGWYCFETAIWSEPIARDLEVNTWLYRKARTIVYYSSGLAQRIYSVFPSENFNKVARYLERKYGKPNAETDQILPMIGEPSKMNITAKWRQKNADGTVAIMEIRKYDNIRGMIPDTKVGFIRLYREGSQPIFRSLSESDLMLQSLRAESSDAPPAVKRGPN